MTETVAQRHPDRTHRIAAALTLVIAACWAYLFLLRSAMGSMAPMASVGSMVAGSTNPMGATSTMSSSGARSVLAMPMTSDWTGHDVVLMWTMWAVMMAAMMLPSATPMIRTYGITVGSDTRSLRGSTTAFASGYLLAWSGFAVLATAAQWALHRAALVDADGAAVDRWMAGTVLLGAGLYQFTDAKKACLGRCRTPLSFLLSEWRDGVTGALRMGSLHGALCIGCCWALMGVLFVLGAMNLWWVATVATAVLAEKITRRSFVPRVVGSVLVTWGALLVTGVVSVGGG